MFEFKIPKTFQLHGLTIKVRFDDLHLSRVDRIGESDYDKNELVLMSAHEGLSSTMVEQTFFHELTHMILDCMGEHKLSGNEKFVHNFSCLLHQFFVTQNL